MKTHEDHELRTPETTSVLTSTYAGKTIEIFHVTEEISRFSRRGPHYYATVDGARSSRLRAPADPEISISRKTVLELEKKAKKVADSWIADDSIRPELEKEIAHYGLTPDPSAVLDDGFDFDLSRRPADFRIGERVVIFGRGCWRSAVVDKITPTKVRAAYVTRHGGQITRATAEPHAVASRPRKESR